MEKKKVLVLLSSYNGEDFIDLQISSILNQSDIYVNLLIRDDGSTDSTVSIIKRYFDDNNRIKLIEGNNIGSKESFCALLRMAKYDYSDFDYYSFSDQDDYWEPNKLKAALNYIKNDSENQPILYCSNLKVTDSALYFKGWMRPKNLAFLKASSLTESICTGCTMVFNYKAIELYCIADTIRIMSHDLWMSHICGFLGKVFYDNDGYILYRQHNNNQIGAHFTTLDKLKMKMTSLQTLNDQHFREREAINFMNVYYDYLKDEDRYIIGVLANYKDNIRSKFRLLFPGKNYSFKRQISSNFWYYIRVIFGYL